MVANRAWTAAAILAAGALFAAACGPAVEEAEQTPEATEAPAEETTAPDETMEEEPAEEPTEEPVEEVTLRWADSSGVDFSSVPSYLAFDQLREDGTGVNVEVLDIESQEDALRAMINKDAEIGVLRPEFIMTANLQGTDIRAYYAGRANEWVLGTTTDVTDISQLEGAAIAQHSPTDLTAALLTYTETEYGVTFNRLVVPGSESRVVALLQGEIDASPVDLAGLEVLEREAPGQFHALLVYEDELPDVITSGHQASTTEVIAEHGDAIQTLVTYQMRNFRRALEEPEWIAEQALNYIPNADPEELLAIAQRYADAGAFTCDGGASEEGFNTMFDIFIDIGRVSEDETLPYNQVIDPRFAEVALAELGEC